MWASALTCAPLLSTGSPSDPHNDGNATKHLKEWCRCTRRGVGACLRRARRKQRRPNVVYCGSKESEGAKRAVIVGAGPAGALLALMLARKDWKVDVFERKQWQDGYWAPGEADGWSVMLGSRAADVLHKIGLKEQVWAKGVVCRGRTSVRGRGMTPKYQAYGYEMLAIPQADLAAVLINSGLCSHPLQISYHFGWSLETLHPETATAEFRLFGSDGNLQGRMALTADLLVGADGLHSKTRHELAAKLPSFPCSLHSIPAGRNLRLRVPVDVIGTQEDQSGKNFGPSLLVVSRPPRLLWGLPNCDGTFNLTLQGIIGSTAADVSEEMYESFPELADVFRVEGEATAQLAGAKDRVQGTVTAPQYHYKQIVLMGDAAHALLNVTHLGTGLALEDCLVLDRLLQESLTATQTKDGNVADSVAAALACFSEERMPEMHEAAQLCADIAKTNMFQVELQQAIVRVITRVFPKVQPWQASANTKVVPMRQLAQWRARETVMVRMVLIFALVLMLLRALRVARLAWRVVSPAAGFLR